MASIFRRIFGDNSQEGTWYSVDSALTDDILGYAGRSTNRAQISNTILARYGTTIKIQKDENGIDYSTFVKTGFDKQLAAGHIEITSVGLGHKVSMSLATLFSEPTQNFDLVGPGGKDAKKASELLWEMRGNDLYLERLSRADGESIWLGCSPVFVEFVDGKLRHTPTDPGKIQVLFETAIESNGKPRPTNRLDIEDATCVVIQTGTVDAETNSFVAIYGRSMDWPDGRYVSFLSGGTGREIPKPGADYSWDWVTRNGKIANPLSLYANQNPDMDLPEYPIAIIKSCLVRDSELFPITDSLLMEALEADVAASHIRATSSDNAKGTVVFTKSDTGGSQLIPKSLRGEVVLEPGQKLESILNSVHAPELAWKLLKESMVSTGQGYTVPDFHLASEDRQVESASGEALKVRARPLLKFRNTRIAENTQAVDKLFSIERALISLMAEGDASTISLLEQCTQTWDPGQVEIPENKEKTVNVIDRLEELGIYDTIEAIRVAYNLGTEQEAIEKYNQLKVRRVEYPPLNAEDEEQTDEGQSEEDDGQSDPNQWN